jgi:hypothetical protein
MQALILIAAVALIWIAVAWLIHKGRLEYQAVAAVLTEINNIPIEEAERRALVLLKDRRRFQCVESPVLRDDELESLADGLRKIFQRYETIESIDGSLILDRKLIGASLIYPEFTVVGCGMMGSDSEFEHSVRGSAEPVYEIYPNESVDSTFGTYSSVYHWVLAADKEARQAGLKRSGNPALTDEKPGFRYAAT